MLCWILWILITIPLTSCDEDVELQKCEWVTEMVDNCWTEYQEECEDSWFKAQPSCREVPKTVCEPEKREREICTPVQSPDPHFSKLLHPKVQGKLQKIGEKIKKVVLLYQSKNKVGKQLKTFLESLTSFPEEEETTVYHEPEPYTVHESYQSPKPLSYTKQSSIKKLPTFQAPTIVGPPRLGKSHDKIVAKDDEPMVKVEDLFVVRRKRSEDEETHPRTSSDERIRSEDEEIHSRTSSDESKRSEDEEIHSVTSSDERRSEDENIPPRISPDRRRRSEGEEVPPGVSPAQYKFYKRLLRTNPEKAQQLKAKFLANSFPSWMGDLMKR